MPTAIRTVTFTVTDTGITPIAPQWAGMQGEHQATRVVFILPDALNTGEYRFRAEWVDGTQSFFTSGFLEAESGEVSLLIPSAWTAAGGTGEIRLIAQLEGEENALQTVYSRPGRLTFTNRDEGVYQTEPVENRLDFLLNETERALDGVNGLAAVTTTATGGVIRFGGKAALAYGAAVTNAGENTEIILPCEFSEVCSVQAGTEKGPLSILSRSKNTFTVYTDDAAVMDWLAVGNI